jgi:hypothetical protein
MRNKLKVVRNLDVDESADADIAVPCHLKQILGTNKNAAILYLKVYDKATAATSSDTPVLTIGVLPSGSIPPLDLKDDELFFSAGISLRATTGVADNDTGAPGANDLPVSILYV